MESKDTTDLLIQEVRHRPLLWDRTLKEYHNASLSNQNWDEVAEATGLTREVAKKVWKFLRENYFKQIDMNSTTWRYFNRLKFLSKGAGPDEGTKKHENLWEFSKELDKVFENKKDSTNEDMDVDFDEGSSSQSNSKVSRKSKQRRTKRLSRALRTLYVDDIFAADEEETEVDDDEDFEYFKSLLPHIKKMKPIKKLKVRRQILAIITEAIDKN